MTQREARRSNLTRREALRSTEKRQPLRTSVASLDKMRVVAPKDYYVYILTNKASTVLYTGVTNDLKRRAYEHRTNAVPGFTARFGVHRLVYYEVGGAIASAIEREKAIKGGSRRRKVELVDGFNPTWRDLYDDI